MDLLSKLVALTLFAAGTATVASAAPSQIGRAHV